MKFRILKDKDKFYPQVKRKFSLHWKYFEGNLYTDKPFTLTVSDAIDVIEKYKATMQYDYTNVYVNIKKSIPYVLGFSIIILLLLKCLRSWGMI